MMKLSILAVGALLASATSANAATASFHYSPAELVREDGARTVHERLVKTATDFCMIESRRSLKAFRREKACISEIADTFVERIDDARLTALHATASTR